MSPRHSVTVSQSSTHEGTISSKVTDETCHTDHTEHTFHLIPTLLFPSGIALLWTPMMHVEYTPLFMYVISNTVAAGKKAKGKFLHSAVSSPQDHSKHFTFYFPDRHVHSDTISASLGSIQPYATINARRLLVHISTSVYSQALIYTAE